MRRERQLDPDNPDHRGLSDALKRISERSISSIGKRRHRLWLSQQTARLWFVRKVESGMSLQIHRIMEHAANLYGRGSTGPVEDQMPRAGDASLLPGAPQMVAAYTLAELRPRRSPWPKRGRGEIPQRGRNQPFVALSRAFAVALLCPCKHVDDVRLRQGG